MAETLFLYSKFTHSTGGVPRFAVKPLALNRGRWVVLRKLNPHLAGFPGDDRFHDNAIYSNSYSWRY